MKQKKEGRQRGREGERRKESDDKPEIEDHGSGCEEEEEKKDGDKKKQTEDQGEVHRSRRG